MGGHGPGRVGPPPVAQGGWLNPVLIMLSRIWVWRPSQDARLRNVDQLNKKLAGLYYMSWLRLKPNGEIDEESCGVDPYELHKMYDSEEVAQIVADHLV